MCEVGVRNPDEALFIEDNDRVYGRRGDDCQDGGCPALRAESVQQYLTQGVQQVLDIIAREHDKVLSRRAANAWQSAHEQQPAESEKPEAPAAKPLTALERAERLIAELSDENIAELSTEELIAKVNMLAALWHSMMKKATKEISKANELVRDIEIKSACKELCSWKTSTLTIAGGVASLGAGFAGLSPKPFHGVTSKVSQLTRGRLGGDLAGRFNMADPSQLAKAGKAYAGALQGAGQLTQGAGSVMEGSSRAKQTASQSAADSALRNKDETTQDSSREGQQIDESQRKMKEVEDKRHQTLEGLAR